jgi:cobalt-zinc-cadmium efflux system outer membrane protein
MKLFLMCAALCVAASPVYAQMPLDEAVRTGLSRNPDLRVEMEQLGVANASVTQAGIVKNPTLMGSMRFPDRAGYATNWEVSLTQDVVDLILRGARKGLAQTQLEAARLRLTGMVIRQSSAIKSAYYRLQADQQELALSQTMRQAAGALADLAGGQRKAGNLSQLDTVRQQALQAESQAQLLRVQGQLDVDRETLVRAMGTPENSDQLQVDTVARLPTQDPELESLQKLALEHRPEIAAARLDARAARQGEQLSESLAGINEIRVGVDSEREPEGEQVTGPIVQFPLPLFDHNQGLRARYQAEGKMAEQKLEVATENARYEVRQAYRKLTTARALVEVDQRQLVPMRQQAVVLARQQYNNMLLGVNGMLTIYREELDSRKQLAEALRDYWTARAELEQAVGMETL